MKLGEHVMPFFIEILFWDIDDELSEVIVEKQSFRFVFQKVVSLNFSVVKGTVPLPVAMI